LPHFGFRLAANNRNRRPVGSQADLYAGICHARRHRTPHRTRDMMLAKRLGFVRHRSTY
jgi:hypothetical protein